MSCSRSSAPVPPAAPAIQHCRDNAHAVHLSRKNALTHQQRARGWRLVGHCWFTGGPSLRGPHHGGLRRRHSSRTGPPPGNASRTNKATTQTRLADQRAGHEDRLIELRAENRPTPGGEPAAQQHELTGRVAVEPATGVPDHLLHRGGVQGAELGRESLHDRGDRGCVRPERWSSPAGKTDRSGPGQPSIRCAPEPPAETANPDHTRDPLPPGIAAQAGAAQFAGTDQTR